MNDVIRGVLFSLGGNIAISVGDHLKVFGDQKRNKNGKKLYHGKQKHKYTISSRLIFGLLGYFVMISGQICNGYALAFAPQTLLACIGSIQFIMNLICSAIITGRQIKGMHIIGTLSIIIGCLIMIFGFSPKSDQSQLTVYALFYNFNSLHYRNYLIVVVCVFMASVVWQYIESNYLEQTHQTNNHLLHTKANKKNHHHHHKKRRNATPRTDQNRASFQKQSFLCFDPKYLSAFFYSFSSAMTGTQSVVLGKTLAIIIRNYMAGKIIIFMPLDLFILAFIFIVFLSFLITFAFWLYRRTESMVLFDTVFIAPMNQVMWLTFSTVAGGIYFHEFENAHLFEWIALILGMCLNYIGLYYLVPTAADQPILIIINMEKPQKKKVDDVIMDVVCNEEEKAKSDEYNCSKVEIKKFKITKNENHKKMYNQNTNIVKARSYIENDSEYDAENDDESKNEHHFEGIDIEKEEIAPLLPAISSSSSMAKSSTAISKNWFQALFV